MTLTFDHQNEQSSWGWPCLSKVFVNLYVCIAEKLPKLWSRMHFLYNFTYQASDIELLPLSSKMNGDLGPYLGNVSVKCRCKPAQVMARNVFLCTELVVTFTFYPKINRILGHVLGQRYLWSYTIQDIIGAPDGVIIPVNTIHVPSTKLHLQRY